MDFRKNLQKLRILAMTVMTLVVMSAIALAEVPSIEAYENDDNYIYGIGYGEPDQSFSAGIRAAELDAYRKCAESAALALEEDSIRDNGYTSRDTVNARMQQLVRGLHILKEGRDKESGQFYAVVRLPKFGATKSLAKAVFDPAKAKQEAFAKPQAKIVDVPAGSSAQPTQHAMNTVQREGNYTGVIIDCRGMNLKSTMSPVIKNERGEDIYGYKNLDYDKVVSKGMAGYAMSVDQNVGRAGSHPLVLKAVRVDTRASQNHVDPVISMADADKMLAENSATGFLNNCAVVFVR